MNEPAELSNVTPMNPDATKPHNNNQRRRQERAAAKPEPPRPMTPEEMYVFQRVSQRLEKHIADITGKLNIFSERLQDDYARTNEQGCPPDEVNGSPVLNVIEVRFPGGIELKVRPANDKEKREIIAQMETAQKAK